MSRLYLSNPCAFLHYPLHTAMRAQSAPGFPCALCPGGSNEMATTRAKTSRGNESACLSMSLRGAKRRSNPASPQQRKLDRSLRSQCGGELFEGCIGELASPRPACGERHRPPSAAVSKDAEAKLRLCRIARCDPGEGVQVYRWSNSAERAPHPSPLPAGRGDGFVTISRSFFASTRRSPRCRAHRSDA